MSKRTTTKRPKQRSEVQRADDAKPREPVNLIAVANVLSTPRDPNRASVKATADIGNALSVESQKTVSSQQ